MDFKGFVRAVLLSLGLFASAPRETFWRDVRSLDDPTDEEVIEAIRTVPTHYSGTYSEFYCDPVNGSNVNGGSDSGAPSMSDTAGTGSWDGTSVYISVATTGAVTVGQFLSIYSGAATVAAYTGRITVVTGGGGVAWHITLSTTAVAGALPGVGATYKAQCGGAWLGPNAAVGFPFNYVNNVTQDSNGDFVLVNMKNNATYSITANITHNNAGIVFQGYTSSVGDLGRAIIDGGTTGASYQLLTVNNIKNGFRDLIFQNNGATGVAGGISFVSNGCICERVTVNNTRTAGFNSNATTSFIECEAYACNQANSGSNGGFSFTNYSYAERCISHANTGSASSGFTYTAGYFVDCIADSNGQHGFNGTSSSNNQILQRCTAYNNPGNGVTCTGSHYIENCTFANNGTYGVKANNNTLLIRVSNCGFYSNTSGQTNGAMDITGSITYASQPMNDPANGDFTVTLASGQNAGRGNFTQNPGSYSKTTTSYPDVGAVQHLPAAAGIPNQVTGARSIGTY
jgi:hypothetical protein